MAFVLLLNPAVAAACPPDAHPVTVDGPMECAPCMPGHACPCGARQLHFCEGGDKRDGAYTRYDEKGTIKLMEGTYKKGVMVGSWTTWSNDGTKKISEGTYDTAGIPVGPWLESNGSVEWSVTYTAKPVNGKPLLDGPWEQRSASTTLRGQYTRGKRTGHWIDTWQNHLVREEGEYKDDVRVGTWATHREDGTLEVKREYRGPDREYDTHYRPDGVTIDYEGEFANTKQNGEWKTYHPNGQLAERKTYLNGSDNGPWETFRDDGSPKESGAFTGWATGEWKLWAADGQLEHQRHYRKRLQNMPPSETVSVSTTATARIVHVQYDNEVFDEEYAFVTCERGTTRKLRPGVAEIEDACELPDGTRHGAYQSWTEDSRRHLWQLVERGRYDHGTKVGRWVEHAQRVDHK